MTAPRVDLRRAQDRFTTRTPWLDSRHSFSFGPHYDPANTSHGVLVAHNDDRLTAGGGFAPHAHRDLEILTWVLRGSLVHRDSTGRTGVVHPGVVQRMSAGSGVVHSERNDAFRLDPGVAPEPVHYVQMWVLPDEPGGAPDHEQREVDDALAAGGLVPIASGIDRHGSALSLRSRYAALHAARLQAAQSVRLPEAPYLHLFVAVGAVTLEGTGALGTGDAARLTATGGQRVTATGPAEFLVWEMHYAV